MKKSELEQIFEFICNVYHIPPPERECRLVPHRRFRWDFCWRDSHTAVEIQGGVYSGGRHTRGKGYERDMEKHNLLALDGWTVLYFTGGQLRKDPAGVVAQVRRALEGDKKT